VIRRVLKVKERGFPGAGRCGQYQQNGGGESGAKEGAIEDAGRRVCRREKPEGSQRVVDGGDGYGGTWLDGPKGKRSAVLVRKRGLSTRTSPARARAGGRASKRASERRTSAAVETGGSNTIIQ